jgi:hypothetical protein
MGDVEEPGKTTFIHLELEDVDFVSVLKRGRLQSGSEIPTDLWREDRRPYTYYGSESEIRGMMSSTAQCKRGPLRHVDLGHRR